MRGARGGGTRAAAAHLLGLVDEGVHLPRLAAVDADRSDLRGAIFDDREVIEWHRILDFQRVHLLAHQTLHAARLFRRAHRSALSLEGVPTATPRRSA